MERYWNVEGSWAISMTVCCSSAVVGHLPRKFSAVFSLFLRSHGGITCKVNGSRRFSRDLPQGGLENPCILMFSGQGSKVDIIVNFVVLPSPRN